MEPPYRNPWQATLGWLGGTWSLGSLVAAAETLSFAMDHRVEVLGNSCPWDAGPEGGHAKLALGSGAKIGKTMGTWNMVWEAECGSWRNRGVETAI